MLLLPRGAAVALCLPQCVVLICAMSPTAAPTGACGTQLGTNSSNSGRSSWFGSSAPRSSPKFCPVKSSPSPVRGVAGSLWRDE